MVKTGNLFLIIILAFSSFPFGCIETNVPTPLLLGQFYNKVTDVILLF